MPVSYFNLLQEKRHRKYYDLLKEWHGDAGYASTEVAGHVSRPEPLASSVQQIVAAIQSEEAADLMTLHNSWQKVCGAMMARMLTLEGLQDGVLLVSVRHNAFLLEIKGSLPELQKRINDVFGKTLCREIRIVVSGRRQKIVTA